MDDPILINRVDRLDYLHSLVRQDLKEVGIKLPKLKRLKKLNRTRCPSQTQDDVFSNRIFGEPLYHVPGTFVSGYGCVPQFLIDAAKVVDKNIEIEGIFRKSGSVTRQKELLLSITDGKSFEAANIYDVAVLIKQFFRELPEPLFVTVYHESFIKCYNLTTDKNPKRALLELCLLLPLENIGALRFTLHMLSRVASKSEKNKMTPNNLALVMAPNLMHLNKGTEKMSAGEEKLLHVHSCIIELLIKNWDLVGMVSTTLRKQLSMMSEYFANEDDLEMSDDNTLEDSNDVVLRKKRKRSGSLTGFVSSIAHGFAKLRRSTDGKSIMSTSSSSREDPSLISDTSTNQTMELFTDSVTPCVMRKKQCVDNVPFSASKKQAILGNLPQKSALASTPFTPASTVKRGQQHYHSAAKTVNLNATTPALGSKTSRKKLNLFTSPGSNKKVKRQGSSCDGLESPPALDKSGKGKNFFRRLSGNRATKRASQDISTYSARTEQDDGQTDGPMNPSSNSPPSVSTMHEVSSTPPAPDSEVSIVVVDDLVPSNEFVNDAGALIDALKRQKCVPGSVLETNGHNSEVVGSGSVKSKSATSPGLRKTHQNDLSGNTCTPVLQLKCGTNNISGHMPLIPAVSGELKVNTGLRRSRKDEFERDTMKSGHLAQRSEGHIQKQVADVNFPKTDLEFSRDSSSFDEDPGRNSPAQLDVSLMDKILSPPQGFGDQTLMDDLEPSNSNALTNQAEEEEEIDVGSDLDSVSGFSTTSGGTIMRRTQSGRYLKLGLRSTSGTSISSFMSYDSVLNPSMKSKTLQSSVSTDSLLSVESRMSDQSAVSVPKISRCTSSDSGKGSLLGDIAEDVLSDVNGKNSSIFTNKNGTDMTIKSHLNKNSMIEDSTRASSALTGIKMSENFSRFSSLTSSHYTRSEEMISSVTSGSEQDPCFSKTHMQKRRSISAEQLGSQAAMLRSSMRNRPHSIHASPGKRFNYKPHLEITRETHNLLARAGYLKPTECNSNSKYVQVEVKSPKRSSYREEMMLTLGSSFRERHSLVNTSIRSVNRTFNTSEYCDITQEKSTSMNTGDCEKSVTHYSSRDIGSSQDVIHDVDMSDNHPDRSDLMKRTSNTEKLSNKQLSLTQVEDCEKTFTENKSHEILENDIEVVENDSSLTTDKPSMELADKEVIKPAHPFRVLKSLKDTDSLLTLSGILDKETAGQVKIKRAQVMLPRHESIVHVQQAGLVAQSVRQFTKSQVSGQTYKFAMPKVTKRGTSPIRIPSIFVKSENSRFKHTADLIRERTGSDASSCKSAGRLNQDVCGENMASESNMMDCDETSNSSSDHSHDQSVVSHISLNNPGETTKSPPDNVQNSYPPSSNFKGAKVELSESLMETITDACTPRSVKHPLKRCDNGDQTKSPLLESTNTAHTYKEITERVKLRTSGGLTPGRITLHKDSGSQNQRNTPMKKHGHHVKRLQVHNSPRRRNVRSPTGRTTDVASPSDTLQVLSSVDIHIDE